MRYFLLDRVTHLVLGESASGIKNVTLSDPVLHDHFPDFPIMPGALIIEGAAQLAGFLLEMTVNQDRGEAPIRRALLVQIRNAKFHATAGPGDQLEMTVGLDSVLSTSARVSVQVTVDGNRIAAAQLTFSLQEIDSERVHEQRRYIYRLWTRRLTLSHPIP